VKKHEPFAGSEPIGKGGYLAGFRFDSSGCEMLTAIRKYPIRRSYVNLLQIGFMRGRGSGPCTWKGF
jgi:hypothetical protein